MISQDSAQQTPSNGPSGQKNRHQTIANSSLSNAKSTSTLGRGNKNKKITKKASDYLLPKEGESNVKSNVDSDLKDI